MTARATNGRRYPDRGSYVSAKDLAEMGFCEKRVLLAQLHGEQTTPSQQEDVRRGLAAHQQYYEQGVAAVSSDRRCFIATCVFGESAPQTQDLRAFRDSVLLPHWWGRLAVGLYYRIAPAACAILRRSPRLLEVTCVLLGAVVTRCKGKPSLGSKG